MTNIIIAISLWCNGSIPGWGGGYAESSSKINKQTQICKQELFNCIFDKGVDPISSTIKLCFEQRMVRENK